MKKRTAIYTTIVMMIILFVIITISIFKFNDNRKISHNDRSHIPTFIYMVMQVQETQ